MADQQTDVSETNNNYYNNYNESVNVKKVPSIETLNSEMPGKEMQRERGRRMFKIILNRLRLKRITKQFQGEGCVEKPLTTLWKNYTQSSRPDVRMQLTVSGGGLKATTKDHGLTEYWAHRLTTCSAPPQFPRIFCWALNHTRDQTLYLLVALALMEFKRDKISRQNARLSLVNSVYENPTIPRRKILLSTGSHNYKPPLERSKSAPKLTSIEEIIEEEADDHCDTSASSLLDRRKSYCFGSKPTLGQEETWRKSKVTLGQEGTRRKSKVTFSEELTADEKTNTILEELVQSSLSSDLVESCERAWFTALNQKPDLIPLDSDEGSLSSGCESASTATSDTDPIFPSTINEEQAAHPPEKHPKPKQPESVDFKLGCAVLNRVRSFEKIANPDLLKCCGMSNKKGLVEHDEVSLVPVGESPSDFSSLKFDAHYLPIKSY
ncbi:unnamed protein product [Phaedon cochleariae]|uniref:PID domain-containing protein n=1 Tax=Phaedon cochleariae TaxID=80249 RepID=A0A9N9SD25_PHACE|nr:unnamed protein product [Phaedon cochleariae]